MSSTEQGGAATQRTRRLPVHFRTDADLEVDSDAHQRAKAPRLRAWHIHCEGCGATEDDKTHFKWVACDRCLAHGTPRWCHAECVNFLDVCDEDFVCWNCRKQEKRRGSSVNSTRDNSGLRPCTIMCSPPGCPGGRGCPNGMGTLSDDQYQVISELVLVHGEAERAFLEKTVPKNGEEAAVFVNGNWYPCKVINWLVDDVEVDFTSGKETKRIRVPQKISNEPQILRFAPGPTTECMETLAQQYGLAWGAKQLRFEMRRARRDANEGLDKGERLMRGPSIAEFIREKNEEQNRE